MFGCWAVGGGAGEVGDEVKRNRMQKGGVKS